MALFVFYKISYQLSMKICIVTVTFRNIPDRLFQSVERSGVDVDWIVHHHGASLEFANHVNELFSGARSKKIFHMANRGLAASWNEGIHDALASGADCIFVVNDDLEFVEGGFEKFCRFISGCDDMDLFFSLGSDVSEGEEVVRSQDFACFAVKPSLIEKVGYFDENFFPAYYEDVDYSMRMSRVGAKSCIFNEVILRHERSSSSKNKKFAEILHHFIKKNAAYLHEKWGGGDDEFLTPFNRKFDCRIDFSRRRAPYGRGFDRSDLDILDLIDNASAVDVIEGRGGESKVSQDSYREVPFLRISSEKIISAEGGVVVKSSVSGCRVGGKISVDLHVFNRSNQNWCSTPNYPINLSYHWYDALGEVVVFDGMRTKLPKNELWADSSIECAVEVQAPAVSGRFKLVITVVQERHTWLENIGFAPAVIEEIVVD